MLVISDDSFRRKVPDSLCFEGGVGDREIGSAGAELCAFGKWINIYSLG